MARSEESIQRRYRLAKATELAGMGEEESERLVVPRKPGNPPRGPGGGKGSPGTRNRRRER